MLENSVEYIKIRKVSANGFVDTEDLLAVEEPLEIQLSFGSAGNKTKKMISVTMRTPGNDHELAAGFLFTEGIITDKNQIIAIQSNILEPNKVTVTLSENAIPKLDSSDRNFYTTSSCGVCGKASIDAIKTVSVYQKQTDEMSISANILYGLQAELKKQQEVFQDTGGIHASALFDLTGHLLMLREDVGRHNALDKLIGASFLNADLPLKNVILLLSGRASFELIQKASMAGIRVIAAIGAPSSLALQLAKDFGITLVGFLNKERFNIYSGNQRILV